ncbi:MAG: hypothetical protein ACRDL5_15390 [Solirubrobacteraceae bacterium]
MRWFARPEPALAELLGGDGNLKPFPGEHAVDAFGLRIAVGSSVPEMRGRVAAVLPPGATPCRPNEIQLRFGIARVGDMFQVVGPISDVLWSRDPALAESILAAMVGRALAQFAPEWVFLRAESAIHEGRAILVAGPSMSGKSILLAALAEAGAQPFSDVYTAIGADGLLHVYRPHAARDGALARGEAGWEPRPVPVKAVVITDYRPGATWSAAPQSPASATIQLLQFAATDPKRVQEALAAVSRLAAQATVFTGPRGEAHEVVSGLLGNDGMGFPSQCSRSGLAG